MLGIVGTLFLFCVVLAIVKPASKTPGIKAWFGDLYKLFQLSLRILCVGILAAVVWAMFQIVGKS